MSIFEGGKKLRRFGYRSMCMQMDADLLDMFDALCKKHRITRTQGIKQYFKYLDEQEYRKRKLLNAKSTEVFELEDRDD